jgi:hypothetical protein
MNIIIKIQPTDLLNTTHPQATDCKKKKKKMSINHSLTALHPPPAPETHTTTRSQIRTRTHQVIGQLLRDGLYIQERDAYRRQCLEAGKPVVYNQTTIQKRVNILFEKKRKDMLKQSFLYDRIFYMKANKLDEYYNLDTLERRVTILGQMFAQRGRARELGEYINLQRLRNEARRDGERR